MPTSEKGASRPPFHLARAGVAVELDDRWTGNDGRRTSHIWLGALAALSFAYAVAVVLGLIAMGQ